MKRLLLKIIYYRLACVARAVIKKHRPIVIAITGSVGKTSTKEALSQILKDKFGDAVRSTSGNLNAEIGIPLTILGYSSQPKKNHWPIFLIQISKHLRQKKYPKFLVLEMGVEHPGDIDYFCSIVKPSYAVVTAATPAHLANFSSLKELQEEKVKLARNLSKNNIFFNSDDLFLQKKITNGIGYGIINDSSFAKASNIRLSLRGNSYDLKLGEYKKRVNNSLLGEQMIYSDLAAATVAYYIGVSIDDIAKSLSKRIPYLGRMNLLAGKNGINIIDDTYNANPASVIAACNTLNEIDYPGRKVLILGNMNELGPDSEQIHRNTAVEIAKMNNIEMIIFVGPNAETMKSEANDERVKSFSDRRQLEAVVDTMLMRDDLVLIKASQNNNYFEELVKILLAKEIDYNKVLVRQGKEWLNKK